MRYFLLEEIWGDQIWALRPDGFERSIKNDLIDAGQQKWHHPSVVGDIPVDKLCGIIELTEEEMFMALL
jgi:hypothetical protein